VIINGEVTWTTEDPDEMLPWSIRIAARYSCAAAELRSFLRV
jgi:hypothetical protein